MARGAPLVPHSERGCMASLTAYRGLFLVAFGAATVLPFQSEPLLVGMLVSGQFSTLWVLVVASIGNVLGAALNGVLRRFIDRFHDRPWFPVKASLLERAARLYRRYGRWSLLMSWMPVFGDALTVLAGGALVVLPSAGRRRKDDALSCAGRCNAWHARGARNVIGRVGPHGSYPEGFNLARIPSICSISLRCPLLERATSNCSPACSVRPVVPLG